MDLEWQICRVDKDLSYISKGGEIMDNNMYMFKDNETNTEIIYVIAQFVKSKWWRCVDFPNIDDAKECLEKVRKKYPDIKFGLFEKIQKTTINMLDEGFI